MKAWLIKYLGEKAASKEIVDLPDNYDGDPYGATVPFVMASNWELRVIENHFEVLVERDADSGQAVYIHSKECGGVNCQYACNMDGQLDAEKLNSHEGNHPFVPTMVSVLDSNLQAEDSKPDELGHTRLPFVLLGGWDAQVLSFPEEHTTRILYNHQTFSKVTQMNVSVTAAYWKGLLSELRLAFYMKKLVEPRKVVGHARPLEWESFNMIFDYQQEGDMWTANVDLGRFNNQPGLTTSLGKDVVDQYNRLVPEHGRILIQFPNNELEAIKIRTDIRIKPPGGVL